MSSRFLTDAQLARLHAIRERHGFSHDDVKLIIANRFGAKGIDQLTPPEYWLLTDVILPGGRAYVERRQWFKGVA